jgi:hypothetical protein
MTKSKKKKAQLFTEFPFIWLHYLKISRVQKIKFVHLKYSFFCPFFPHLSHAALSSGTICAPPPPHYDHTKGVHFRYKSIASILSSLLGGNNNNNNNNNNIIIIKKNFFK